MNERKQFIAEHPFLIGIFIGWMGFTGATIVSFILYMVFTVGSVV